MNQLIFFLILLACPLMMVFMMRGMHGGGHRGEHNEHDAAPHVMDTTTQDNRIAELEGEVAQLREAQPADDHEPVGLRR